MSKEPVYPARNLPKTKIVCTLGPATDSEEVLKGLVENGMSIARLNMSHGDVETHTKIVEKVRKVSSELGIPVGLMVDVPGTKYRTGPLESGTANLIDGEAIVLTSDYIAGNKNRVTVTPPGLHRDASSGGTILVDDGNIELIGPAKFVFDGEINLSDFLSNG